MPGQAVLRKKAYDGALEKLKRARDKGAKRSESPLILEEL